ncbi:MAG: hypothetical protein O2807_07855 [bacterium]|nr:hypothetical protein [bacterium]
MKRGSGVWIFPVFLAAVLGFSQLSEGAPRRERQFADVIEAALTRTGPGAWRVDATISSPDTGWKKYANAFRVRTEAGKVLGVRVLYHPHVDEQPFTRSLEGVKIPPGVRVVIVEARDSVAGWGGKTARVGIPR